MELGAGLDPMVRTLLARRRHLRLSQQAVASRIGTHQSTVSDWEAGGGITLASLRRLCAALGYELQLRSVAYPVLDAAPGEGWSDAT